MNGVWQSRCRAPGYLEPLPTPPYGHLTEFGTESTGPIPTPAVCPSGLGTRLQSEVRGFNSRHGLCVEHVERAAPPVGGAALSVGPGQALAYSQPPHLYGVPSEPSWRQARIWRVVPSAKDRFQFLGTA